MNTILWQQVAAYVACIFGVRVGMAISNAAVRRAAHWLTSHGKRLPARSGKLAIIRAYAKASTGDPPRVMLLFLLGLSLFLTGAVGLAVLIAKFGLPLR